ncbi:spore coat protein [Bacillus sp. FJAT-49711]|uniref:spore coat protein n=1 Tax=Bacillus sp. FJAT-49711 TaxID=2833585 RepID=UPI001BC9A0F1|nr:spore coat protein [Bacillus sp. FJAT-49711]MBS4219534.1 spore coat protein [Bacillus sp. FJAT-49711]
MGKKPKPKPELIWKALEETKHPCNPRGGEPILNKAGLVSKTEQSSSETIEILDSCDITVSTTDLQAAVSLQSAIAIVVNFFIADSALAEKVTQGLFERAQIMQTNQQRLVIVNSRSVDVTTVDTGVVISFN